MHRMITPLFVLALIFAPHARAQTPAPSMSDRTITGVGVATIQRPANLLRMQVDLTAQGADAKEAVTKLRAAEAAARKKLVGLGAKDDAVTASPARDMNAGPKNPRQAQMEFYVRQQMARGGKKPTSAPASSVTAGLTLTADFPLTGSGDELLVSATELTRKIKDADVGGKKDAAKNLTPEQQEEQEEQQGVAEQAAAMGGDPTGATAAPGEPRFSYVAKLSDDEQQKAAAEAFAKAKAQAERLAKAAGATLGELHQLSSQRTNGGITDQQNPNDYATIVYTMMSGGRIGAATPAEDENEAVGPQPTDVVVKYTVTASFAIR